MSRQGCSRVTFSNSNEVPDSWVTSSALHHSARLSSQEFPMFAMSLSHDRSIRIGLCTTLALLSAPLFAQDTGRELPEHAEPDRYGRGWTCSTGYRKAEDRCESIEMPANAYLTDAAYGTGWRCERGYLESGGECLAVEVPPHGYLTERAFKPGWACERGYRASASRCVAINVPENGYLTDSEYGDGWECDRGYRADDDHCVAIDVPAHAYLTNSVYGTGWKCERGYTAVAGACASIDLPAHAYLKDSGDDWLCARNYARLHDRCVVAGKR
ncbi:hypothetical protein [Pseudohaliea sp.]|uniref:hypothetical protein n=1 Tax=Pseudohaliea sp. TaxID=2740289 RepID=UPI0032EAB795